MPKEQIRKRGRRKPKPEIEEGAVVVTNVQVPAPLPSPPVQVQQSAADVAAPTAPIGIHPSRLGMLAGKPPKGQSHKTPSHDAPPHQDPALAPAPEAEQTLEWSRTPVYDPDFPFGTLDPDIKAYFRDVEDRIKDWEGVSSIGEEREDRQLFLSSVLTELRGNEVLVATDPDCAVVLERLLPSMGDWGRRVIGDSFGDKWVEIVKHRFGSHVVQTWLTLAGETVDREARGIFPPQQAKAEEGELPTMTTLILTIITSVLPSLPTLLTSPHASPPMRLLLLVITPNKELPSLDGSGENLIRSKKSKGFRKGHGVQGKSILMEGDGASNKGKEKEKETARLVPAELVDARKVMRKEVKERIHGAEWRSMGVDTVGSAAVQLLLEYEIEDGEAESEGSLLDHLTEGLISQPTEPQAQPFLTSLLSSTTGSRLFESILLLVPRPIFTSIWHLYFQGKIGKLAAHPVANFIVAKGVSRLDTEEIEGVVKECLAVSGARGLIKTSRTSVLQSLVDRATAVEETQKEVVNLIVSALDLPSTEKSFLVPCLMTLKTYPMYTSLLTGVPLEEEAEAIPAELIDADAETAAAAAAGLEAWKNRRKAKPQEGQLAPNMQGCLLLQAMVGLKSVNEIVIESLLKQDATTLMAYAHHSIASHLLDKVLTAPTVPIKYKRRLINLFMGQFRQLAEDRMGSRVADTIWDKADGFMREKIARSLIPEATALSNSTYGRFFAKKLNLHLLQRRPDEWRELQIGVVHHFAHEGGPKQRNQVEKERAIAMELAGTFGRDTGYSGRAPGEDKKRKNEDEIDELFKGVEKRKKEA
ncbi:nucleolar protein 9, partial [Tremellales sp. Uapishka_1]